MTDHEVFDARRRGVVFGRYVNDQIRAAAGRIIMGEDREYQFIGETGYETPWQPIPEQGLVSAMPKGKLREKLGRTYGVAIRIAPRITVSRPNQREDEK